MRDQAFRIVKAAIEELNEELEYDTLESVSDDTPIFGGEDGIDSLSLVRLVVAIEQRVSEELDTDVVLSDEKAMSAKRSPYRTAASLADFVAERLALDCA